MGRAEEVQARGSSPRRKLGELIDNGVAIQAFSASSSHVGFSFLKARVSVTLVILLELCNAILPKIGVYALAGEAKGVLTLAIEEFAYSSSMINARAKTLNWCVSHGIGDIF